MKENRRIYSVVDRLSTNFNSNSNECAIILAAGHGKRIKSNTSKMLHTIWQVPTVERVYNACNKGIDKLNTIIVVGIKAKEVMEAVGKRENNLFALQEEQNGTGHAVQVALNKIKNEKFKGTVYILPGDMGLLDKESMNQFKSNFDKSNSDMMVLTGIYEGDPEENAYGRIIRVKSKDKSGKSSGEDQGKVIEIKEHKDILALDDSKPYEVEYKGRTYSYSREEIIKNNEYNSGVYAFKYDKLKEMIGQLSSDNVQGEVYITDLIYLFNNKGYSVGAVSPEKHYVVMGFNTKSVLKEMENIARDLVYDKLKDIIRIDDPDDFFIHDKVVDKIIKMDEPGNPVDIEIGSGAYIGKDVELAHGVRIGRNVTVKGNVKIGEGTKIGAGIELAGSDKHPLRIEDNVEISGNSFISGSYIEEDVVIEHSIIINKKVRRLTDKNGNVIPVKFVKPEAEGFKAIDSR